MSGGGGDGEDAAEREGGAAGAAGVGLAELVAVFGDELLAGGGVVGERGEDGAQCRALGPFQDGVLALEELDVGGLPGVDGAAGCVEEVEVAGRVEDVDVVAALAGQAVAPVGGFAQFGEECVAGGGEVAGDLEGEGAAGDEGAGPAGEQVGVVGDPLEGGVGDDQVVGLVGGPGAGVGVAEADVAAAGGGAGVALGGGEHLGGGVEAGDVGVGPAFGEQGGDVAGAAAEVGDAGAGRGEVGYAGEEVVEGAAAVSGVA